MVGEPVEELLVDVAAQLWELLLELGTSRGADLSPEHVRLGVAKGVGQPILGRCGLVRTLLEEMLAQFLETKIGVFGLVAEQTDPNPGLLDGLAPIPLQGVKSPSSKRLSM